MRNDADLVVQFGAEMRRNCGFVSNDPENVWLGKLALDSRMDSLSGDWKCKLVKSLCLGDFIAEMIEPS